MMEVTESQTPVNTGSQPLAIGSESTAAGRSGLTTGLATAAVVGVGAALIEVEWIPGLLLGVAAMVAPGLVPKIGRGVRPFVHSAIKNGYAAGRKTREWMAEAGEQVSDMVAEVRASAMESEPQTPGAAVTPAAGKVSASSVTEPLSPGGMQTGA